MDNKYYMDMIISYLRQWGEGTRADFVKLLSDKLPDVLNDKQKANKVRNLLTSLNRSGLIEHINGNHRTGVWVLTKSD